jgi:hypothetical protein
MDASTDEVLLRVPARSEYGRIVRVGAAALGLRQGMSFSEIDDLRLAIDEAVILLLDGIEGGEQTEQEIRVVFRIDRGALELHAERSVEAALDNAAVHRFDAITAGLIDDYDLDQERGWVRVRKIAGADDD